MALVFLFVSLGLSSSVSQAQSSFGGPTEPLPFNQTVTGDVRQGDTLSYTFDIPADQDVAVVLESARTVVSYPCSSDGCSSGGGSGSDSPTRQASFYPATGKASLKHTVEINVSRPLEGTAAFRLTAYTVTPTPLLADGRASVSTDAPIQAYTLESSDRQTFSVEIEDGEADGQFLWVASQPYLFGAQSADGAMTIPNGVIDSAASGSADGLRFMQLYHVGGNSFRVYVGASVDYQFHTTLLSIPELARDQFMTVDVSYRQPIQAVYLSTLQADVVNLYLKVLRGAGAFASVYTPGNSIPSYQALGVTPNSSLKAPLSAVIRHPAKTNRGTYAVIQVPAEFTRDSATVQLLWNLDR